MKYKNSNYTQEAAPSNSAGFLLLNSALQALYVNDEAVRILGYPHVQNHAESVEKLIAQVVQSATLKKQNPHRPATFTRIKSGRRQYTCRLFSVCPLSDNPGQSAMALLMERNAIPVGLMGMAEEFKLTPREYEAVQHLALGLTSKEISARMGVSPNTAKAFLRLVMIKTGVTTRSGIIGKLLKSA